MPQKLAAHQGLAVLLFLSLNEERETLPDQSWHILRASADNQWSHLHPLTALGSSGLGELIAFGEAVS